MASSGATALEIEEMQPQGSKFDDNGEEILYEAECDSCGLVCNLVMDCYCSIPSCNIICCSHHAICIGCAIVNNWRLYLTKQGVHRVEAKCAVGVIKATGSSPLKKFRKLLLEVTQLH